jgi:hypothetical protein
MSDDRVSVPVPEPYEDSPLSWVIRGQSYAKVIRTDRGVEIHVNNGFDRCHPTARLPVEQAHALGAALLAAVQGADLPADVADWWDAGVWRSPHE